MRIGRREFLAGAAAGAGALALGRDPAGSASRAAQSSLPLIRGGRFTQGVASGEPTTGGATLWTKVDGIDRTSRLQVEISRDEDFRSVLYRQDVVTDVENGFAVHHRAEHPVLKPGEQYFYRFYTCDENSPVGRFRTFRPADSREPVRVAFFSCQAYEAGFYTAHAGLAEEDLDLVVCLGDYIYEKLYYDNGARQDKTGRNGDGYIETLAEYRQKYALYHSDPNLREVRRKIPMLTIWDDHEVEDNWARDEPGHQAREGGIPFLERRANGFKAFFEHMPRLRVPAEPNRTYGTIPLGSNAEVILLDQRSYRDKQPCGDQFVVPCAESEQPGRTLLGATQKQWLKDTLAGSKATWKLVANQAMIMSLDGPGRNEINKDQWDGYAAERQEILEFVGARGVKDVSFITGDIHSFFAGRVTPTGRAGLPTDPAPVATEFVTGSITSEFIVPEPAREAGGITTEAGARALNPHFDYVNFRSKGYGVVRATPDELEVTFRSPGSVLTPQSAVSDLAKFRVARGSTVVEPL